MHTVRCFCPLRANIFLALVSLVLFQTTVCLLDDVHNDVRDCVLFVDTMRRVMCANLVLREQVTLAPRTSALYEQQQIVQGICISSKCAPRTPAAIFVAQQARCDTASQAMLYACMVISAYIRV